MSAACFPSSFLLFRAIPLSPHLRAFILVYSTFTGQYMYIVLSLFGRSALKFFDDVSFLFHLLCSFPFASRSFYIITFPFRSFGVRLAVTIRFIGYIGLFELFLGAK
jgi:hypothetical protein